MISEYRQDGFGDDNGINLDSAIKIVAPLLVNTILKKHPGLIIGIILVDTVVQMRKCHKHKKRFGELILLTDFR